MNLIIAFTPLQILIALKIIEKHSDEDFYGVVFAKKKHTKILTYAKKLENACKYFQFIPVSEKLGSLAGNIDILRWLFYGLKIPQADNIYLCNLDWYIIRLLLPRQHKANLITFDDGTANLQDRIINSPENQGTFFRYICKFFRIPSAQKLLKRQTKHYSIYPYPNNMGPSEYLPLFTPAQENKIRVFNEEEIILLGQPIYEMQGEKALEKNIAFTERIIKEYHITKYFPHPREDYYISNIEYIDSPLIIEDYLMQELKEHPERKYIIYSYCSTAVLNLQGISKQIEFVLLKPQDIPELLQGVYALFDKLGVQITQLPYGANDLMQGEN